MANDSNDITAMLIAWTTGQEEVGERLMAKVYDELRRIAAYCLEDERAGHSLDPTALVHEAYLRLIDVDAVEWQGRLHFFRLAARTMRRILIDHARALRTAKRGGDVVKVPLDEVGELGGSRPEELLILDEALSELAEIDPKKAQIVEMRYFAGVEMQDIARLLEVSPATVNRHWRSARAWLFARLRTGAEAPEG